MKTRQVYRIWLVAVILGAGGAAAQAVPMGYLYWFRGGAIYRGNLDGSQSSAIVTGRMNPSNLAVYGNRLYWSEQYVEGVGMSIRSANLDGSDTRVVFPTSHNVYDIDIDPLSGSIYFDQYPNVLMRADGATNQRSIIRSVGQTVGGVAIDPVSSKVIWSEGPTSTTVRSCSLNGTQVTDLVTTNSAEPGDIDYDYVSGYLYWVNGAGTGGQLYRSKRDGTAVQRLLDLAVYPRALTIDRVGGYIYIADGAGVFRCDLDGADPRRIHSKGYTYGVAVSYVPEPGCLQLLLIASIVCISTKLRVSEPARGS